MAELRIDYDLTVSKANQIKALSDDMLVIINKLKKIEADVPSYWNGEASNQYLLECEKLLKYLIKLDSRITEFGDSIIKIANIIKEADESVSSSTSGLPAGGGSGGGGGGAW